MTALAKTVKRHTMTFHSSLFPGLCDHPLQPGKESMIDGQTAGHPKSIGPQPLGIGPKHFGRN